MRIFFFIAFLFFCSPFFACECNPLQPISKDLSDKYDVVFYGKVDSVSSCRTDGVSTAYFTIIELYKGSVSKNVKVEFDCSTSCLMSFSKGEEWLLYVSFRQFDILKINICDHSRKLFPDESQDIYQLTAHRTFEEEKLFLKATFGIQKFAEFNEYNAMHEQMGARNEQPSNWNKLWLLLISFASMGVVYFITRKNK